MTAPFIPPPTVHGWNDRIAATPGGGTIFQSYELGEVKRMARWTPRYAVIADVAMTVHEKGAAPFRKVWYLPKGPSVSEVADLAPLVEPLREAARREGVLFVRLEPEIRETEENHAALQRLGLVRSSAVQPHTSTVVHELPEREEDLLTSYPSKTRNMVRRAQRDERCTVELATPDEATFEAMWSLWAEVVADQGLAVRSKDYHLNSWRILTRDGLATVVMAHVDEEPAAFALVGRIGTAAAYKEGASLRRHPVPGVSQLLQYEGMRWAISEGARTYDLVGVPHSSQLDDPDHPRHGLGVFKRGFTRDVIDWVGGYDIVIHPRRYAAWNRLGERVVTRVQRTEPTDVFW